jgi:hypothetical protein
MLCAKFSCLLNNKLEVLAFEQRKAEGYCWGRKAPSNGGLTKLDHDLLSGDSGKRGWPFQTVSVKDGDLIAWLKAKDEMHVLCYVWRKRKFLPSRER